MGMVVMVVLSCCCCAWSACSCLCFLVKVCTASSISSGRLTPLLLPPPLPPFSSVSSLSSSCITLSFSSFWMSLTNSSKDEHVLRERLPKRRME